MPSYGFKVVFPDPRGLGEAGFGKVAHIPSIFDSEPGYEQIRYTVTLRTNAPKEKVEELHQLVMRTSPNFSNFASPIKMIPTLVVEAA